MLGQILQEYYIMLQERYQQHLVDFCCWLRILRCLFPRPMRTSQSNRLERLRICFFCVAKILVGNTQTLELHPMDADLASRNEKVYGSNTLSAIGKQLFPAKKENSDELR